MGEDFGARQYADWWIALPEDYADLPEPIRTLVLHVEALQDRIDGLPDEFRCACAYDHPADICMVHAVPTVGEADPPKCHRRASRWVT